MVSPGLVDRRGLLDWANSMGARGELPRLIRRLILETGQGVVELGFPAGEGVSLAGWDGTVRASAATPYIPLGMSVWELSVDRSPGAKADQDYGKRLTAPAGKTVECTYVALSLRPWAKRSEWAADRTAEGRWRQVRALGVDDVETWLEHAPVSHAWLSELMGLHPHGLETAESWWMRWSSATAPAFPAGVVLAGRNESAGHLRNQLDRPGALITIRGSADEVAAFVTAYAQTEGASDGGALLARTVCVTRVEAWRRLRGHEKPLVIVALTEEVAADFALDSSHVLVVPVSGAAKADIGLPPIDSLIAAEVLKGAGLPAAEAGKTAELARLALLAARRRLAIKQELLEPEWARTPAAKSVRRLVLIGRWHEDHNADRALVQNAVGVPYEPLSEEIASLRAGPDPFLARLGGEIGLVSPFDAWLVLGGHMRRDDLEALQEAARIVFAERDPRWELPEEDRWRASLLTDKPTYSGAVRHGLATTLALLGAEGSRPIEGTPLTGRDWAGWIVRDVIEAANADASCQLWASLHDVMPLLAEAAPDEFLQGVRVGVSGDSPRLRGMFSDANDEGGPFGVQSAHPGLLWALETCVWSPGHFGGVIDVLARLAELDPGGRSGSRPLGSLVKILLPWRPQNSVSPERRIAAIDGLRERHKAVAWKLLLALLPSQRGMTMDISCPRFRDWKPEDNPVTSLEYWRVVDEICSRVVEDAGRDPERWISLIYVITDLPSATGAEILGRLHELAADEELDERQRTAIWEALRATAATHREYADAAWALPSHLVAAIETTAARFEPVRPSARHRWLFNELAPEIPEIARVVNHEEYTAALVGVRARAAAAIADSTDWVGLSSFAHSLDYPGTLGAALALAGRHEHECEFLLLLQSTDEGLVDFAAGYFGERFRSDGWPWLEGQVRGGALEPQQVARLLLSTRDHPRAWEEAEAAGEEGARCFWTHFLPWGLGQEFGQVDYVAERLLDVGRPNAALELLHLYSRGKQEISSLRAELAARGLEQILECGIDASGQRLLARHRLVELFAILERAGLARQRLARLEWAYLPAVGINHSPATLGQILSEEPGSFVDVIRRVYRSQAAAEDEGDDPSADASSAADDTERAEVATNAYRLLSEWRTPPGLGADGMMDRQVLNVWVDEAREKLCCSGHLEAGDLRIGYVLASAPPDADGSWPGVAVRDLLERLQSAELRRGLANAMLNSRGVTTRGAYDGGEQERVLASSYLAEATVFADRWPVTAALLRELARDYEREARELDEQAERHRLGFRG